MQPILSEAPSLLSAVTEAQSVLADAQGAVKALKDALSDLEDRAMEEAIEDPQATNEARRKSVAARWLRESPEAQAVRSDLAAAARVEAQARITLDDAERHLKAHFAHLRALGEECQVEAARLSLEGYARFAQGARDILAARRG